jgi:hypothetical protein
MKALLIDPFLEDIAFINIFGNLNSLYKAIDCDCITSVRLSDSECMFLDDNGLYRKDQRFFIWEGYPQPLAGRGLILGFTEDGDNTDTALTLEQAREAVRWADLEFSHTSSEESTVDLFGMPMKHLKIKAHFKPRSTP